MNNIDLLWIKLIEFYNNFFYVRLSQMKLQTLVLTWIHDICVCFKCVLLYKCIWIWKKLFWNKTNHVKFIYICM